MNLPLFILGLLIALALVTYLLRNRESITSIIATVATAALAVWLWSLDMSESIQEIPFTGRILNMAEPLELSLIHI